MSKHENFIMTSITQEIEDALSAICAVGDGIETYPLSEYFMHSLFLKITGFQEQKLRCIVWELGTDDFEFRRWLLSESSLGQYSSYRNKNDIYVKIVERISDIDLSFSINSIDKNKIKRKTIKSVKDVFENTILSLFSQRKYLYFVSNIEKIIDDEQILVGKKNFFKDDSKNTSKKGGSKNTSETESFKSLLEYYKELYQQRNRLAHNILSYQDNLPSLVKLYDEDDSSRNYFIWITILVLIDNIFMELYRIHKDVLEKFNY